MRNVRIVHTLVSMYPYKSIKRHWAFICLVSAILSFSTILLVLSWIHFSSVFFDEMPYENQEELWQVQVSDVRTKNDLLSGLNVETKRLFDFLSNQSIFQKSTIVIPSLLHFDRYDFSLTAKRNASTQAVRADYIYRNFFETLESGLYVGDINLYENAVVISYEFWREKFAKRLDVIGQWIDVDGELFQVAGVAKSEFYSPTDDNIDSMYESATELWIVINKQKELALSDVITPLTLIVREKGSRATLFNSIKHWFTANSPLNDSEYEVKIKGLKAYIFLDQQRNSTVFIAAMSVLFLASFASSLNFFYSKLKENESEIAIKLSFCRTKTLAVSSEILLSLVLTLFSFFLSFVLLFSKPELFAFLPKSLSHIDTGETLIVLGVIYLFIFLTLIALVTYFVTRIKLYESLAGREKNSYTYSFLPFQKLLLVFQTFVALIVVCGGVLILENTYHSLANIANSSFRNIVGVEVILDNDSSHGELAGEIALIESNLTSFYPGLNHSILVGKPLDYIGTITGYRGFVSAEPLKVLSRTNEGMVIEGTKEKDGYISYLISVIQVSEKFFSMMNIPLLEGAYFSEKSHQAVITDSAKDALFPGVNDVLGQYVPAGYKTDISDIWHDRIKVVGQINDLKVTNSNIESQFFSKIPVVFIPFDSTRVILNQNSNLWILLEVIEPNNFDLKKFKRLIFPDSLSTSFGKYMLLEDEVNKRFKAHNFNILASLVLVCIGVGIVAFGIYGLVSMLIQFSEYTWAIKILLGASPLALYIQFIFEIVKLFVLACTTFLITAFLLGFFMGSGFGAFININILFISLIITGGAAMIPLVVRGRSILKINPFDVLGRS